MSGGEEGEGRGGLKGDKGVIVKQERWEPLTLQIKSQWGALGAGGHTASSPTPFPPWKATSGGDCNVTGVGAGAQHRPAQRSWAHQTSRPGRARGAGSPRRRLPLPPRRRSVPPLGLAPTFFGFRSHVLFTSKSSTMTMDLMSLNWKLLTPQQASSLPPPPSTYPNHLPSGLSASTLQLLPSLLFPLCQTPPKPFTNSSAPLASCALQFTWIVSSDIKNKKTQ